MLACSWDIQRKKNPIKIGQKIKNLHLKIQKSPFVNVCTLLKQWKGLDYPKPISTCIFFFGIIVLIFQTDPNSITKVIVWKHNCLRI